jgi:CRISPR-associated protein Csm2
MRYTREGKARRNRLMPDNRNFQQNNRGGGGNNWREQPQALPPVVIDSFYKDTDKNPKDELFEKTAREIAKSFYIENGRIGVSKTQLRRLFDEVKRFEQILETSEDQESRWESQKPYIKMINSKVSYAVARAIENKKEAEKRVYKNLQCFITQGIGLVNTPRDFHVCVSLFEAAYGFYYEINHSKD